MDNERDKTGIIFTAVFVPVVIIAIALFLCCKINPPTPPSSLRPHRPPRNPEPAVHVPAMGCAPLHPIVQTPISTPEPVSSPLMLPPPAISSPRDVHSPRSTPSRSPLQPAPADVSSPISEKPPPGNVRFAASPPQIIGFSSPATSTTSSQGSSHGSSSPTTVYSPPFPTTPTPGSPNPANVPLPQSPRSSEFGSP
jgi:hypothetical protein